MLHTQLHGTHWQIGFQLGAGLARDNHFILDAVPFPITPGAAGVCPDLPAPLPPVVSPAALEELRGLAQGAGVCPGQAGRGPLLHVRHAARPLLLLLCLAQGRGALFGRNSDFLTGWKSTTPTAYTVFRRRLFFCGQHHLLPPDGGRRQSVRTGGGTHLSAPSPPARAECWSDPAAPAGVLPGCSPGPGAAPAAPRLLLPHAGAGRPGWAYRPGRSVPRRTQIHCPGETDAFVCSVNSFHLSRHGPLPPADGRRLAGGRTLSDPHPLPGRLGPELDLKLDRTCSPAGWASCASEYDDRRAGHRGPCSMTRPPAPSCVRGQPGRLPLGQTPGSRFVPDLIRGAALCRSPSSYYACHLAKVLLFFAKFT